MTRDARQNLSWRDAEILPLLDAMSTDAKISRLNHSDTNFQNLNLYRIDWTIGISLRRSYQSLSFHRVETYKSIECFMGVDFHFSLEFSNNFHSMKHAFAVNAQTMLESCWFDNYMLAQYNSEGFEASHMIFLWKILAVNMTTIVSWTSLQQDCEYNRHFLIQKWHQDQVSRAK